jgi:hypothetical protein
LEEENAVEDMETKRGVDCIDGRRNLGIGFLWALVAPHLAPHSGVS